MPGSNTNTNNSNSNQNYNTNNSNEFMPYYRAHGMIGPHAVAGVNYSKASTFVKRWLAKRPHTIHKNVVNIKLPENAMDPVWRTTFTKGNEAIMVIKKRVQSNGAIRSKRTFYKKNTIERLAGSKKWNTILGMKASAAVFKDPINRRTVYRRDIMHVKFIS